MLAVDKDDIDRDADYSDNEWAQHDPYNDFSLPIEWQLAFILKFVINHEQKLFVYYTYCCCYDNLTLY